MTYFSIEEMSCKDGTAYPAKWRETRWRDLQSTLNVIRAAWGAPIVILSGYRSPEYNRKIGGARASQHMEGRAADLRTVGNLPKRGAAELHAMILQMYDAGQLPLLGGLGEYPTFCHVDVRDGNRLARWSGSRVES